MLLSELHTGESAVIFRILGHGAFRKRMLEMGFVRGQRVDCLLEAPLTDPVKYSLMGYEVSLRRSEASMVEVIPIDNDIEDSDRDTSSMCLNDDECNDRVDRTHHAEVDSQSGLPVINVALIGNPNCGKTSLFNFVSGAHEHVGNYSGVTVDSKNGHFRHGGYEIHLVDLPGTYSLAAYSPEEKYVRQYLRDNTPDVILNVVVASNLERNLYLTTELIDMDRRMVIALNMYDELERRGDTLDCKLLGKMIGVPVVPTVSRTGRGLEELFDKVVEVYEDRCDEVRHVHVKLGDDIEQSVTLVKNLVKQTGVNLHFSPRYVAIKLLEDDIQARALIEASPDAVAIEETARRERTRIENLRHEDIADAIANEKYGFISGALAETFIPGQRETMHTTHVIDALVTNRVFGFPLFLAAMFVVFWLTFDAGAYPMDWIEHGVQWLGNLMHRLLPEGVFKDMVADGIIGGVGGVIVFLPNILILYFCISFMEDSGYMARAAFIMDRLMHRIGLHGKSFIPLMMGFGCNVPAIMGCRAIESPSSRIITILINPFMSCSARVPIYVLLVGAFFPQHAALVFLCLYATGILVAMLTAKLLRKTWFKNEETPFVMELPPYRVPTLTALWRHTWGKGKQYLKKMGGIILVASIIVWALNYFPLNRETSTAINPDGTPVLGIDDSAINLQSDSYLEMIGKAVNPVMVPLGFHWRATVAAVAGVPAKEIVVSTLGVLYTGDEEVPDAALSQRLKAPSPVTGEPDFTAAAALAFMVFILLYCPCIATVTAIIRETRSWRYGAFSIVYNTLVAWVIAWVVYRIALLV